MEWVETTGKTIDEAKSHALDRLGVAEEDAEFEVLDEPRTGLFGRLRGEARVRARVRPTQARQKMERRDRRRSKDKEGDGGEHKGRAEGSADITGETRTPQGGKKKTPRGPRPSAVAKSTAGNDDALQSAQPAESAAHGTDTPRTKESMVSAEQVGQEAILFLDGLVAAFGLDGATTIAADGDSLEAKVDGDNLGLLVGPRGTTLQAVQELTRVAAQRRLGDHDTRLRVDVGGYRERRQAALQAFAVKQAEAVKESGVARVLEPMSSADRKVIHDALGEIDGIATRSEGEDPQRRVIIAPAG
jgi:spoIIIJ-associated protein